MITHLKHIFDLFMLNMFIAANLTFIFQSWFLFAILLVLCLIVCIYSFIKEHMVIMKCAKKFNRPYKKIFIAFQRNVFYSGSEKWTPEDFDRFYQMADQIEFTYQMFPIYTSRLEVLNNMLKKRKYEYKQKEKGAS